MGVPMLELPFDELQTRKNNYRLLVAIMRQATSGQIS